MTSAHQSILALGAALTAISAPPAWATPGGKLATLPLGSYICALPGDAAGNAVIRVPERDFAVIPGSSYASNGGKGTYLLTGKLVRFTSGPMKGQRFEQSSSNTVRIIGIDGQPGDLRCTRLGRSN